MRQTPAESCKAILCEQMSVGHNLTNKEFWKAVRPFISHKTDTNNCHTILSENNVIVKDRSHVADILNEYFMPD